MSRDHKPARLYLVDGSSYLFRAFHALPPLTSPQGMPTNVLYGVSNMLRKLRREAGDAPVVVVFDAGGKTFRHELYPEYKANRPPMPEDLRRQIEPMLEMVDILGLPLIRFPGVEADDVIGTLVRQARARGMEVVVSTGDKDMAQLVQPGVELINTMDNRRMDSAQVLEKFGVRPDQIVDWLALVGDASDNIPGVPGVGPKTASRWLKQYGNLDTLIAHADNIGGKVGEKLRANLDQLRLSQELARIRTDLELPLSLDELNNRPEDSQRLQQKALEYGFRSWLDDPGNGKDSPPPRTQRHYQTVRDMDSLNHWVQEALQQPLVALDLETDALDAMRANIVGFALATGPGRACYIPVAHIGPDSGGQLDRQQVLTCLQPLLQQASRRVVGQHFKFDLNVLARAGVAVDGPAHDTMLESYVLDPTGSRHDMDTLAKRHLGEQTLHYEDVAGKGKQQIAFDQVPVQRATEYAAEDADITLRLHHTLWPKLEPLPGQCKVYRDIELPLIPVLANMERTGVRIDCDRLRQQSRELGEGMQDLEQQCHALAGQPFNLGSPKQLQQILFEDMGLPVKRKTPKGQPSTAEDVLEALAAEGHELPALILRYRSLSKLKSTYTDKLPTLVNPDTGRVHTSYHQAVTATGRLSSSDPNLQNIPIRTAEGRRIREAFIPPEGWKILACDYSQIELRIMAHLSGDAGLLQAFREGRDIHAATAEEIFGSGDGEHRRAAKAINFGLIYCMSAFGLSRQLGIGRNEAQAYIDRYFDRYPGVHAYMEQTRKQAALHGYVETLFGRRLFLPDIRSRNPQRRQAAERAAINAPMQGTAADIIKRAMIEVHRWLAGQSQHARLLMQVHDELVLEVHADALETIRQGVVERMQAAAELHVPLLVEAGAGDNWEQAH